MTSFLFKRKWKNLHFHSRNVAQFGRAAGSRITPQVAGSNPAVPIESVICRFICFNSFLASTGIAVPVLITERSSTITEECGARIIKEIRDTGSNPVVPTRWTFLLFIQHLTKRNKGRMDTIRPDSRERLAHRAIAKWLRHSTLTAVSPVRVRVALFRKAFSWPPVR